METLPQQPLPFQSTDCSNPTSQDGELSNHTHSGLQYFEDQAHLNHSTIISDHKSAPLFSSTLSWTKYHARNVRETLGGSGTTKIIPAD